MTKSSYDKYFEQENKQRTALKKEKELEFESKKAIIEANKKSWNERNPLKYAIAILIIGALITELLRLLIEICTR